MLTPQSAAIDPGLPAEQMRKRTLAGLMTMSTGGLLPSHIKLSTVHDVLKIACGTGEWCLDMASTYPTLQVTGVDTNADSIASARTQADVLNLAQVSFHCLPSFLPLPFPDASFDLVHARFLSWHLLKEEWEPLLKECHRVSRNGATLQVTDYEMGITTSLAHEQICSSYTQTLWRLGRSFSPDGHHLGVLPMLKSLVRAAGFEQVEVIPYAIDYGAASPNADAWYRSMLVLFKLMQPFFLKTGAFTPETWEQVYHQAEVEMLLPDFQALWIVHSVWGRK